MNGRGCGAEGKNAPYMPGATLRHELRATRS